MTTGRDSTGEWLDRARQGDDQAFEQIYQHFKSPIYRFIWGWVHNRETARDLTHETFLRLFRALPRLRDGTRCGPLLYRIARNAAIDELRRRRTRPWSPERAGGAHLAEAEQTVADPIAPPDQQQLHSEGGALAAEAINRLSPRLREVFWMVVVLGETLETTATQLGLNLETAKKRLARGRMQVRHYLERRGVFPRA